MARTRQKSQQQAIASSSRTVFQRGSSNFLSRLWTYLASCSSTSPIQWSKNGSTIVVSNPKAFLDVLETLYNHSNFETFQRQMSIYGFSRSSPVTPSGSEPAKLFHLYRHPTFDRSTPLSEVIDCPRHANSNSKKAREGRKKTSSSTTGRTGKGWASDGTRSAPYAAWAGRRPDVEKELSLGADVIKKGARKQKVVAKAVLEDVTGVDGEAGWEDQPSDESGLVITPRNHTSHKPSASSSKPSTRSRPSQSLPPSFQRLDSAFSEEEQPLPLPVAVKTRAERMVEREAKRNEAAVIASVAREKEEQARKAAREKEEELRMAVKALEAEDEDKRKVSGEVEDPVSHGALTSSVGFPAAISRKRSPQSQAFESDQHLHVDDEQEVLLPAINLISSTHSSSPRSLSFVSLLTQRSTSTSLTSLASSSPTHQATISSDVDIRAAINSFPAPPTTDLLPLPIPSLGFEQHRYGSNHPPSSFSPASSTFSSLRSSTSPPPASIPLRARPRSISSTSDQAQHQAQHLLRQRHAVHPYAQLAASQTFSAKAPTIPLPLSRRRASTSTVATTSVGKGDPLSPTLPFPFSLLNLYSVSPTTKTTPLARVHAPPFSPVHPYAARSVGSPIQPSFIRTPLFEEEKDCHEDEFEMEFDDEGTKGGGYESDESFGNQPGEDGSLGLQMNDEDAASSHHRARFPSNAMSSSSSNFSDHITSPPLRPYDPQSYAAQSFASHHFDQHQQPYAFSQLPPSSFGSSRSPPIYPSSSPSYSPHMISIPPPRPSRPHQHLYHHQSFPTSSASENFPQASYGFGFSTSPPPPANPAFFTRDDVPAGGTATPYFAPVVERSSSHAEQGAGSYAHIRRHQSVGDLYGRSGGGQGGKWW